MAGPAGCQPSRRGRPASAGCDVLGASGGGFCVPAGGDAIVDAVRPVDDRLATLDDRSRGRSGGRITAEPLRPRTPNSQPRGRAESRRIARPGCAAGRGHALPAGGELGTDRATRPPRGGADRYISFDAGARPSARRVRQAAPWRDALAIGAAQAGSAGARTPGDGSAPKKACRGGGRSGGPGRPRRRRPGPAARGQARSPPRRPSWRAEGCRRPCRDARRGAGGPGPARCRHGRATRRGQGPTRRRGCQ